MGLDSFLQGIQQFYDDLYLVKSYCIRSTKEEFERIKKYITKLYNTNEDIKELIDTNNLCDLYHYLDAQEDNYFDKFGVYFAALYECYSRMNFNSMYDLLLDYKRNNERYNPLKQGEAYDKKIECMFGSGKGLYGEENDSKRKEIYKDVFQYFQKERLINLFYDSVSKGDFSKLLKMLEDYEMLTHTIPWVADYAISKGAKAELHHLYMPKDKVQGR